MKILKINKPTENEFIEGLLSNKIFNDNLFEHTFFTINLCCDTLAELLHRRYWETVFLKKSYENISKFITKECISIKLSLSEAIDFIYAATPPAMKHLIPDSLTSIDEIYDNLVYFLMDETNQTLSMSISCFKRGMHLIDEFEYSWDWNTEGVDFLRRVNSDKYNLEMHIACQTGCTIQELFDDKYNETSLQIVGSAKVIDSEVFNTLSNQFVLGGIKYDKDTGLYYFCGHIILTNKDHPSNLIPTLQRSYYIALNMK